MESEQVRVGQRIRVNMPGLGDHGQLGTVKRIQYQGCYIHLDWDPRPYHVVLHYPADLEGVPDDRPLTTDR